MFDPDELRASLERDRKVLPRFEVQVVDEGGETVARVTKTLYVRRKG